MPLNRGAIVKVLEIISVEKGLQCTATEAMKGAVTAGACAFGGALLGGPIGMGIGGALGSLYAAVQSKGKFKSVVSVLQEMTPQQLMLLENNFQAIFQDIDATDIAAAATLIMSNGNLQGQVLQQLAHFFKEEMALQLAS